jgi:hypothetical protein
MSMLYYSIEYSYPFPTLKQYRQYSHSLWTRRSGDQIPVEVRFFTPVQTGPGAYPAPIQRVPWWGRGFNHPPQSSAEVKERVELYLYFSNGPSWPAVGQTLPTFPTGCTVLTFIHCLGFSEDIGIV